MKAIYLLLIMLIFLSGCQARKKSIKTDIDTATKTELNQSIENQSSGTVQNNKVSESSNNIQNNTEDEFEKEEKHTEYYPPDPSSKSDRGAIKSETTTTTKNKKTDKGKIDSSQKETDKGKSESKNDLKSNTNRSKNSKASIVSEEKTKTTPNRLPYIFGIIAAITVLLIVFRKSPILKPIWALFSKISKSKSNG